MVQQVCALCGADCSGTARCDNGHFVCDACHSLQGYDVVERVCSETEATDPCELATQLMRSPSIAMHGPEHHFLVPAVLLATFDNATGRADRRRADVQDARRRAERVPGGFCGTHGNCGAAVGTGVFWSIATSTTPLSTVSWSECNRITARSLVRIAEHGGPRCCKRNTYHALLQAMAEILSLQPVEEWAVAGRRKPVCEHTQRNKQCLGRRCSFHRLHGTGRERPSTDGSSLR